jgi:elongation factor 1-beta
VGSRVLEVMIMPSKGGQVIAVVKVFPEGDEVSLDDILNQINQKLPKDKYSIVKTDTEPIAFGLKALVLFVQMPEELEGGTDELESLINEISGVSHAEVESVSRLSF